jgi:hypothetical protein
MLGDKYVFSFHMRCGCGSPTCTTADATLLVAADDLGGGPSGAFEATLANEEFRRMCLVRGEVPLVARAWSVDALSALGRDKARHMPPFAEYVVAPSVRNALQAEITAAVDAAIAARKPRASTDAEVDENSPAAQAVARKALADLDALLNSGGKSS